MSNQPKCARCGITDNLIGLGRKRSDGSYYTYLCREHNKQRMREYRQTVAGAAAARRTVVKYEAANPERRKAWSAARKLPKMPCERCGTHESVDKHHDDPRERLAVTYLCRRHHMERHAHMRGLRHQLEFGI